MTPIPVFPASEPGSIHPSEPCTVAWIPLQVREDKEGAINYLHTLGRYTILLLFFFFQPLLTTTLKAQPFPWEQVVATWGDHSITLADFKQSYFHYWQSTEQPDSPELRTQVAREMLEQRIIADQGRTMEIDRWPAIQKRLDRDVGLFTRTKYVEEVIRPRIKEPTDEEIERAVSMQQQRYYVRQLFSLTKEGIDSLDTRLSAGEDFIELASTTLPDPNLARNGGALGWLAWGDTDLPVEDVLYDMDHGDTSDPVQSLMGWHIFRVDSLEQTYQFGQPDQKTIDDTRAQLFNRRFDYEAAIHIRELVWAHDLAMDVRILRGLWQSLAPLLPNQADQLPPILDQLAETPPIDIANEVVAYVDGNPFYARQFFDALPNLPRGYLGPNLKQAVEIAIRDSLLTDMGKEKNYHFSDDVLSKAKRAEDTYIFTAMMQMATDSVRNTSSDLQAFYEQNQRYYIKHTETEVWEILLANPDSALALTKAIHARLDFKQMARENTLRDSVRASDGYLGFVKSTAGPVGERAATLLPGALYGPIENEDGYSVIQTGIKVPVYYSLEEILPRVRQDYEQALFANAYQMLLPGDYNPKEVIVETGLLQNAFD